MEAQHQMLRINEADVQPTKHQVQLAGAASPPPSASSSPSHEFSFTISLHPPKSESNNKSCPPPFAAGAIDLSPADEIFFHGHLLPLHLLSHLPASPRSSTNSLDSFTLPIKELLSVDENNSNNDEDDGNKGGESRHVSEGKGRGKSKSFSLFAMPKWRKEREEEEDHEHSTSAQKQRKSRFELLKRYVRFVKPFLSLRGRGQGSSGDFLRQQPYSYSGNLRVREKKSAMRGRRGEFSAPASMRTSPANSGLLVASGCRGCCYLVAAPLLLLRCCRRTAAAAAAPAAAVPAAVPPLCCRCFAAPEKEAFNNDDEGRYSTSGATTPTAAGKSDSTMEELQAAIQAAIAHCKKSIAAEDKIKLHP